MDIILWQLNTIYLQILKHKQKQCLVFFKEI